MRDLPPREVMQHLIETATAYRQAFEQVQEELERTDLGRVPAWVFAIDRLPIEEVREMSPALADAEERRRSWRTALQALIEHVALDVPAPQDGEATGDKAHLRKLDRFITVVNLAKAGGCIYLDGRFEPVTTRARDDEGRPTSLPPTPAASLADTLPAGLPKG